VGPSGAFEVFERNSGTAAADRIPSRSKRSPANAAQGVFRERIPAGYLGITIKRERAVEADDETRAIGEARGAPPQLPDQAIDSGSTVFFLAIDPPFVAASRLESIRELSGKLRRSAITR
jgi:hypothetical protein